MAGEAVENDTGKEVKLCTALLGVMMILFVDDIECLFRKSGTIDGNVVKAAVEAVLREACSRSINNW